MAEKRHHHIYKYIGKKETENHRLFVVYQCVKCEHHIQLHLTHFSPNKEKESIKEREPQPPAKPRMCNCIINEYKDPVCVVSGQKTDENGVCAYHYTHQRGM